MKRLLTLVCGAIAGCAASLAPLVAGEDPARQVSIPAWQPCDLVFRAAEPHPWWEFALRAEFTHGYGAQGLHQFHDPADASASFTSSACGRGVRRSRRRRPSGSRPGCRSLWRMRVSSIPGRASLTAFATA